MVQSPLIRICFVAPNIYSLFNPMVRVPFTDADQQIYELARYFGKDETVEINVLTDDYGQEEVEFYSGVLVFRGSFENQQSFFQRFFRKKTPLQEILHKIGAHAYIMAGASGQTKPVSDYCRSNRRAFIFRVSHQRDCDGTFVHGDPEGKAYRQALHQADYILCQTEEQQRLLQRTEKLTAFPIPNLVARESVSDATRTDVIWIGEAVEWKQPELFLRLALTIPHQNFTILTRPSNPDYFERLVSKTRDVPNLGFENSVPYYEWPNFLRRSLLAVNTSRYEGFPFAFSQALAFGAPVASLNVDPDGILENRQIGICANGSEVRLAQGVSDLIAYPRQWKRLSDNAIRYDREKQNPDANAEEYRKIFVKSYGKTKQKRGRR